MDYYRLVKKDGCIVDYNTMNIIIPKCSWNTFILKKEELLTILAHMLTYEIVTLCYSGDGDTLSRYLNEVRHGYNQQDHKDINKLVGRRLRLTSYFLDKDLIYTTSGDEIKVNVATTKHRIMMAMNILTTVKTSFSEIIMEKTDKIINYTKSYIIVGE